MIEGKIERFAPGGLGILRDDAGLAFIRGGLVGETIRAEVEYKKGKLRFAQVVEVVERSEERVVPDCALHPECGGCAFLDLSEKAQLAAKREMVLDALRRTAKMTDASLVEDIAPAPMQKGGRIRARFAVDLDGRLAYRARGSHDTITPFECPALAPALDAARQIPGWPRGAEVALAIDESGKVSASIRGASVAELDGVIEDAVEVDHEGNIVGTRGDPVLRGVIAGQETCEHDASIFTQASIYGGQAILTAVLRGVSHDDVVELYAGAGHLTVPLLERAKVTAIESSPRAIHYLRKNAPSATIIERFVDRENIESTPMAKTLVVDPPRTGVDGLGLLLEKNDYRELVMVSCDMATGARDLRIAMAAGYDLDWLAPIDAFVRTPHVEWVARLSAKTQ